MNEAMKLKAEWDSNPRWKGIKRDYSAAEVLKLRGSFKVEHSLARMGADRLWDLMHSDLLTSLVKLYLTVTPSLVIHSMIKLLAACLLGSTSSRINLKISTLVF